MENYCVSETYWIGAFNELRSTTVSVKPTQLVKPRKLRAATVMEAGYVVAQFVETLRYKPKGHGSDSR
jgi:hypothetical protein